jgi:hypothetical protein
MQPVLFMGAVLPMKYRLLRTPTDGHRIVVIHCKKNYAVRFQQRAWNASSRSVFVGQFSA